MRTQRCRILWLGTVLAAVGAGCVSCARDDAATALKPGQDLQSIVASAPEGARFVFEPGVYRQQTIYPKDRQQFAGQDGVVLNGAMELTAWTQVSGLGQTDGLPEPLDFHGDCEDDRELCNRREDLFVNGRLYERRPSLQGLGPAQWYYENGRAYLADDPTGELVELSVTPVAFGGGAKDVVLEDLVVEKYASDAQFGAIHLDRARGWQISGVTARWNHGIGLFFGPETRISGGSFSHNGQLGIGGTGEGATIDGVEIAFNNYAGYNSGWEAGGTKFARTKNLIVRNSCVHHNAGPGLWTDIDNIGVLYEGNKVFLNSDDGINHEISYDAIIRDNVVAHNGTSGFDVWLWGAQILIQNSANVEVYDNLVEVSDSFGNGIAVIHQDRGGGDHGPWHGVNNSIHDNTIIHLGSRGQNGVVMDTDDAWYWNEANNSFDRNRYIVADPASAYWTSNNHGDSWANLKSLGLEPNGELVVEQRAPMELSCG
jgi:hypothetical protein